MMVYIAVKFNSFIVRILKGYVPKAAPYLVKIKILRDVRFNTLHYKIDFSSEQAKRVSCYQWKDNQPYFL